MRCQGSQDGRLHLRELRAIHDRHVVLNVDGALRYRGDLASDLADLLQHADQLPRDNRRTARVPASVVAASCDISMVRTARKWSSTDAPSSAAFAARSASCAGPTR